MLLQSMLECGCNPNLRDNDGWTAAMWAAASGQTALLQPLLSRGADLNLQTPTPGWSCLHHAAGTGHANVVQLLGGPS